MEDDGRDWLLELLHEVQRLELWPRDTPVKDSTGKTPLFYGVLTEDEEVCRFLVEFGMAITAVDDFGTTVVSHCRSPMFAKVLMRLCKFRDVFVSYGHHPATSDFARKGESPRSDPALFATQKETDLHNPGPQTMTRAQDPQKVPTDDDDVLTDTGREKILHH